MKNTGVPLCVIFSLLVLQVKLDFPDEYLTMIRGHYGSFVSFDKVYVRSLTFMSNKRKFGPYGVELGTIFSFPATEGKIVGFHGRSGLYLDAIGVYLKPMPIQTPSKGMIQSPNYVACKAENEGYSIIQGSVGQNYDIVLALRQKDEFKKPLPNTISKQVSSSSSSESSDDESTDKVRRNLFSFTLLFVLFQVNSNNSW